MSVSLSPSPVFQGIGPNGILPGGQLFTYAAGTTTPQATYIDSTQTTPNTNPVILNAYGQANVWLATSLVYKLILTDSAGNQIWSVDNIAGGSNVTIIYPQTPAEIALNVIPTNFNYPSGNVLRYGAVGDGVTNDQPAIKTAFLVMQQQGGGTITLPWGAAGVYNIVGTDASPLIPTLQSDLSILPVATPCQLYIRGINNVTIIFEGSTMSFATTSGGYGLVFDVFGNIEMINPHFFGQTIVVNTVVTQAGVNAVGLLSLGQNSQGFTTQNFNSNGCFAGIVATGDPAASTRVNGINMLGESIVRNCEYGYCFQNNGDQVFIENGYTFGLNRPVFIYGVDDINANIIADTQLVATSGPSLGGGFDALVKAYGRRTRNVVLQILYKNNYAWSSKLSFQSQYNPANQAAPAMVENVYLSIDEVDNLPFTSAPLASATSATLSLSPGGSSQAWQGPSGIFSVKFSDNEIRSVTLTNGSATASWSGGLTNNVSNVATGGGGFSVAFSVFAGPGGVVQQPNSSLPCFNNIVIRGKLSGTIQANTAFNTNAQCQINIDGLFYTPPAAIGSPQLDIFNNNGFVSSRKFTYAPVLNFGGTSIGITYGTQTGEYYIAGGICTVLGHTILSAKGSSTGAAAFSLPFPTRMDSALNPIGQVVGNANMAGLPSSIFGFLSSASSIFNLTYQASTGLGSVQDTNFTNASDIFFQVSYPL